MQWNRKMKPNSKWLWYPTVLWFHHLLQTLVYLSFNQFGHPLLCSRNFVLSGFLVKELSFGSSTTTLWPFFGEAWGFLPLLPDIAARMLLGQSMCHGSAKWVLSLLLWHYFRLVFHFLPRSVERKQVKDVRKQLGLKGLWLLAVLFCSALLCALRIVTPTFLSLASMESHQLLWSIIKVEQSETLSQI